MAHTSKIVLQRKKIFFLCNGYPGCQRLFIHAEGGGGFTPLYKLYRYVRPHQVGFLRRFGLKTGLHFAHFGLESGMVFEGTMGAYECIYRFNSK